MAATLEQRAALRWAIAGDPGYVFRAQRIESLGNPLPVMTREHAGVA